MCSTESKFLCYYSWQFCEQDLEDVGRGLGEAIYRYHRMLKSKRLVVGSHVIIMVCIRYICY